LGVIGVGDENPKRKYGEEDIRLLSLFAQQATIGIRNARLYSDAKRQADEANTLREASAIVASTLEQKQAMRLILNQLAKVVPFDSASVLLEKEGQLEIVEGKGFKENSPLLGKMISLESNQPGTLVFKSKETLIVRNMPGEYPEFNEFNQLPILSWIGVPLVYGDRTIGILSLDSFEANRYNQEQARLAEAFAGHVAIALENVRLYQSAIQSTKRLATLYKLSQRISANLQPEEVYHAIHKATKDLMASDSFILSLFDENTQMINDVYFVDHSIPQKLTSRPLGMGLATKVITEKKTIFYNHFNMNMIKRTKAVLVEKIKTNLWYGL
jgi:transcriptional regulator with GAF, ATPase, and Fis domain